jgi:hypothetical protein
VPCTVAEHVAVCAVVIEVGKAVTETEVIVTGTAFTVTVAEPETFVYPACAELAVQVAVPTPLGVSTPPAVIAPPVAVQLTPLLNAPVP